MLKAVQQIFAQKKTKTKTAWHCVLQGRRISVTFPIKKKKIRYSEVTELKWQNAKWTLQNVGEVIPKSIKV